MGRTREYLAWSVGFSDAIENRPENYVPAKVPGAVQLDWANAHGWADFTYGDNYKEYGWMEDVFWSYKAVLPKLEISTGEAIFFVCGGVDYQFEVRVDGKAVFSQEGMFTPFELDLTGVCTGSHLLEVVVFPAPKRDGAEKHRQADICCKPAVSYGWDWHPRLIPLGIWDETYLEIRPVKHISATELHIDLSEDMTEASIELDLMLNRVNRAEERIVWTILDDTMSVVSTVEVSGDACAICHPLRLVTSVNNPKLWWPNGDGDPNLYESKVELIIDGKVSDSHSRRIGFRKVRLVMYPGAWSEPAGYPKSRSHPPITVEINGRRIFSKGTNWVNPSVFPGTISTDTYRPLLELAKDANFNMLRSWGGGIINKECFFDMCDEMGLMVWQEFPLSCNEYKDNPEYLAVLDRESQTIIKRLRSHPCVVLWCGGNELFNGWSCMTDQSLPLRLLDRNCYDLDVKTPFIMTSPLDGMAHGHYSFRYAPGIEVYHAMPEARFTAYAEFGCPGPSSADYIRGFIPEDELWPPKPGTAWETHHAFGVWQPTSWLMPELIEDYFGPSMTLEKLVENGQLLQTEGLKCIYEEARRQWPRCSMALNWCFNEPWPSAANNSIVNWPSIPKPSFYGVRASCRPVLASARIPKFVWRKGEAFTPELWLLNDSPEALKPLCIKAFLRMDDVEFHLLAWECDALAAKTNSQGPTARHILPQSATARMTLVVTVVGHSEYDSEYTLLFKD